MTFTIAFVIRFLLAVLAVYRLAWMFTREDGPFNVLGRFRLWLGRRVTDDGQGLNWTLAEMFNCPHCLGVWLALLFVPVVILPNIITDVILVVLALAGLQSYLTGRGDE